MKKSIKKRLEKQELERRKAARASKTYNTSKTYDRDVSPQFEQKLKRQNPHLKYIQGNPTEPKLSGVIIDYAEPLLESDEGDEDPQTVLRYAIVLWNLAFLNKDKAREKFLELFRADTPSSVITNATNMFDMMYQRKQQYFADDKRTVIDFEISILANGDYHLQVASTLAGVNS
ncbi:MAG: hypothetical protein R2880_11285 [Deinococcales bacterium]